MPGFHNSLSAITVRGVSCSKPYKDSPIIMSLQCIPTKSKPETAKELIYSCMKSDMSQSLLHHNGPPSAFIYNTCSAIERVYSVLG